MSIYEAMFCARLLQKKLKNKKASVADTDPPKSDGEEGKEEEEGDEEEKEGQDEGEGEKTQEDKENSSKQKEEDRSNEEWDSKSGEYRYLYCTINLKPVFHWILKPVFYILRLRWVPNATKNKIINMKSTCPKQTQLWRSQRHLYSTCSRWGLANFSVRVGGNANFSVFRY